MGARIFKSTNKWVCFAVWLLAVFPANGQPLRIAVAANAQFVIVPLQADFEQRFGIKTETVIGSSGRLTSQIINGAPYDIFLSADMDYPAQVKSSGYSLSPVKTYAFGRLIVVSSTIKNISGWKEKLLAGKIDRIAIAKPELAPYGLAAKQALQYDSLWDKVSRQIVYGESIAQVNTYVTSGAVDLAFTTESLVKALNGQSTIWWSRIDEKTHKPIAQGVVVCIHASDRREQAMAFFDYLSSSSAKAIFEDFGYRVD